MPTSMEEICEITERSKGSIYYHFKSKEELFLFVVKQIRMIGLKME